MGKKKLATECGVVCGDNSEPKVVLGTAIQRLKLKVTARQKFSFFQGGILITSIIGQLGSHW